MEEVNMRKNTLKIWDGGPAAKQTQKQGKSWNGFHLLFTASARRSAVLRSLWIWLLVGFAAGTAVAAASGAGAAGVVVGLLIAGLIYFGFRDEIYKKLYAPEHDRGRLYLPEGMTWEDAIQCIYRGFAHPDVDQLTNTPGDITFHSQKYGTYQLLNTEDGLKMHILSKPSKSGKKEYLYDVFCSTLFSQVIALLYPQLVSAAQVEEEKTAAKKLFKADKIPMLIELVLTAAIIVFAAIMFYNSFYSASARSHGISDSTMNAFTADATVGEICDAFFGKSEWDSFEQGGKTYVTCTGYGVNKSTKEKIRFVIYFEDDTDSFSIDHITYDGENLNMIEMLAFLQLLDDNYLEMHGQASSGGVLDQAMSEFDNALDEAFADSSSSVAASEPESEAAESYPEGYEDGDDTGGTEVAVGTNGEGFYSVLAGEISVELDSYVIGEMSESTKQYYLSYGSEFKDAWLDAMYTDVYEYSGKYGNLDAWSRFEKYIAFYGEATDYSDAWDLPQEFYDAYYGFDVDGATDDQAASHVDKVLQLAENCGASLQEW